MTSFDKIRIMIIIIFLNKKFQEIINFWFKQSKWLNWLKASFILTQEHFESLGIDNN